MEVTFWYVLTEVTLTCLLTEVTFKGVTYGTRAGQSWPMDVYLRGNIWYKGRSVSAFGSILTGATSGTRGGQYRPLGLYSRGQHLVQGAVSIGLWVYTHWGNIWYKGRSVSAFGSILTGATSGTRGGQYRPLGLYSRGQHLVQEAVSLGLFLGQFRRPVGHQLFQA